jgi:hypothetical protein
MLHVTFLPGSVHLRRVFPATRPNSPPSSAAKSFCKTPWVVHRMATRCSILNTGYRSRQRQSGRVRRNGAKPERRMIGGSPQCAPPASRATMPVMTSFFGDLVVSRWQPFWRRPSPGAWP